MSVAVDHIITTQAHLIPSSLLMLVRFRALNKTTRAFVDKHLWEWIHAHFFPTITGLPSDLVPGYYLNMMGKFFRTKSVLNAYDRALLTNDIGDIFLGSMERNLLTLCRTFPLNLIDNAEGRAILLAIMDEWTSILQLQARFHPMDLVILADAKHALRNGFVIRKEQRLGMGLLTSGSTVFLPVMVEDFETWRLR